MRGRTATEMDTRATPPSASGCPTCKQSARKQDCTSISVSWRVRRSGRKPTKTQPKIIAQSTQNHPTSMKTRAWMVRGDRDRFGDARGCVRNGLGTPSWAVLRAKLAVSGAKLVTRGANLAVSGAKLAVSGELLRHSACQSVFRLIDGRFCNENSTKIESFRARVWPSISD